MKKTNIKVNTKCCGRCEKPHQGYTVKLDSHGIGYVVCGQTNKRMDVGEVTPRPGDRHLLSAAYPTNWEIM